MTYPGGKSGAGVYQTIINQIPPHGRYFELFAGGGAILRHKRPAASTIAADVDTAALARLAELEIPGLIVLQADARSIIKATQWTPADFVYLDPPYLMETRSSDRQIYRHEFGSPEEHYELLQQIRTTPSSIAISGYPSRMYDSILHDWRSITFQAMTRGGTLATEQLWMNYPQPSELHDYRYLGADYRERERIKRKTNRWRVRLRNMPATERYAMLAALEELTADTTIYDTQERKFNERRI